MLLTPVTDQPHAAEAHAFLADARAYALDGSETRLSRMLRSPHSGVPHDVAAAYATLAERAKTPLLDAIARERLALPAADRDAVFRFAERARALRQPDAVAAIFDDPARLAPALAPGDAGTFVLCEPATAAPRSGVRARQTHFSASALNAYAECARKWFYRYACSAVEDPGSSAATYGTAFHLALEDFHAEVVRPSEFDAERMQDLLARCIDFAFDRNADGFDSRVELLLQKRRAVRTARKYVEWLVRESARAPFAVIGRELSAKLELEGYPFVGYIDRLDRDDRSGGVAVIDYKTGNIAATAAEYRAKVRAFADFQLPFYYWARIAAGDRVTRLALIPLKDALLDVRPVSLEVVPLPTYDARKDGAAGTISVGELERAKARMVELCAQISSGSLESFPPTIDPVACTYCAYVNACAYKPAPEEERFGR